MRTTFMRRLVFAALAAVTLVATDKPSQAQTYPWCVQYGSSTGDGGTTCLFTTYAQCMETARGNAQGCVRNPDYYWNSWQRGQDPDGDRRKRR